MLVADEWKDFELLDAGNGEKLERWGPYVLRRPDPQAIWPAVNRTEEWEKADGWYHRSSSGGGHWEFKNDLPRRWQISYKNLSFYVEPTGFKHTGLFPEQAVNWDWMIEKIRNASRPVRVLNLFAYTGGATVAAASAGAEVCHVDAAKGMVQRAKENIALSGLADKPVRFIVDDVFKFVRREKRRGKTYEGIIMDPPSYGRGPKGELWKIEDCLFSFVEECVEILSDNPLFFLINSYTTGFSPVTVGNILRLVMGNRFEGKISCGELGLRIKRSQVILPCGVYGRWER